MKSLVLIFLVFIVFASAKVLPMSGGNNLSIDQHGKRVYSTQIKDKCDFYCTENDPPVCAENGQCLLKFNSRCAMAAYNCRNPQKMFDIVADHMCVQKWQPMCQESDLKEFGL